MNLILLVGPPGSGKSTLAKSLIYDDGDHGLATVYVNQDKHGKKGHKEIFEKALLDKKDIIVDRMNFNKEQREKYLMAARGLNYKTKIIVLHENRTTCLERMSKREFHETIKDERSARSALDTFFKHYERPLSDEADEIEFRYPEGHKPGIIWTDIDGTVADIEHRRHFVREGIKKDWKSFFDNMKDDKSVYPICRLVDLLRNEYEIVFCSGRPESHKEVTENWLKDNIGEYTNLFMRPRNDFRRDDIVKEIILDFEVLTRYKVVFCLDDRDQVVKMLRSRGLTVLQVAEGDF